MNVHEEFKDIIALDNEEVIEDIAGISVQHNDLNKNKKE
jgi:hypothetical protein